MHADGHATVVVIAGPTATGKSTLAADMAEALDGTVINADSIQVYRDLRVLTARPTPAEEARVPHRLYGVLGGGERCSAGAWCDMALAEIALARTQGRVPIVAGGTGLYLRALVDGLNTIPAIADEIRQATIELHETLGTTGLFEQLERWDPKTARHIDARNPQRVMRAWEVMVATGRPLAEWQADPTSGPPPDLAFQIVCLMPPRDVLYAGCNDRFAAMAAAGAVDEVRSVIDSGLPPEAPVRKAIGFSELAAHLTGGVSLSEAIEAGKGATRRYAKRQVTWFRHQIPTVGGAVHGSYAIEEKYSKRMLSDILSKIRNCH